MKALLIGLLFFFLGASLMLNVNLLNSKHCKFSVKYTKGTTNGNKMPSMRSN